MVNSLRCAIILIYRLRLTTSVQSNTAHHGRMGLLSSLVAGNGQRKPSHNLLLGVFKNLLARIGAKKRKIQKNALRSTTPLSNHTAKDTMRLSLLLILLVQLCLMAEAARFGTNGPVLTITLKDPQQGNDPPRWLDLSALRPTLLWGVSSQQPPLPNWLPSLRSLSATVGYQYKGEGSIQQVLPSSLEAVARFSQPLGELQVQPSYEPKTGKKNLLVQISRGASYTLAKFNNRQKNLLETFKASILFPLPYASVSSLRLTPALDRTRGRSAFKDAWSCTIEGITGGAARTKAVLQVNRENPTLAVVHALDDRNTISPEISLYTAKIVYQWNVNLGNGSSLRTRVDPTSAIHVTWTDTSTGGGLWVTDAKLPLEGTTVQALAADVRVRRQFRF